LSAAGADQPPHFKGVVYTAYIKAQYDGHVETVGMFETYAKGRMKQFANDMLPTLKMHLDHVSKLK
jgi:putative membrane protein